MQSRNKRIPIPELGAAASIFINRFPDPVALLDSLSSMGRIIHRQAMAEAHRNNLQQPDTFGKIQNLIQLVVIPWLKNREDHKVTVMVGISVIFDLDGFAYDNEAEFQGYLLRANKNRYSQMTGKVSQYLKVISGLAEVAGRLSSQRQVRGNRNIKRTSKVANQLANRVK